MRIKLSVLAVFAAVTFLSPMAVFLLEDKQPKADAGLSGTMLKLQNSAEEDAFSVDLNTYLCGALAAEGCAEMEAEALKAMAIVLRTYALKCLQTNPDSPIVCGSSYWDEQTQKANWGSDYLTRYNKIASAVRGTDGSVITYDGDLIVPAYHKISSGTTESAADMWGRDVPYLIGASTSFDMLSPHYVSEVTLSSGQVRERCGDLNIDFTENIGNWFDAPVNTAGGSIKSIKLCGTEVAGQELAKRLGLASPCFTVSVQNGSFVFQVLGIGDGVGLSQNGADYLAEQGKSAGEILAYFYSGVQIQQKKDF